MPQIGSEPVPVTVWLIRSVLVWVQITVSPSAMVMLLGLKKYEPKETRFVAAKAPAAQATGDGEWHINIPPDASGKGEMVG